MVMFWIEAVGWLGAMLMAAAYLLLTMGKISGRSATYQWLNILAAAGVIVNSGWNGAYPSTFINAVWLAIGAYGISQRFRRQPACAG